MLYQDLIGLKRDGTALSPAQIAALARGLSDGTLSDAQAGALAMAIVLRGMDAAETAALTLAMRDSGQKLHWDHGPVLDKHSTGGVGDTVSLVLAPALAACGAVVPMISGRGLGHTGGTLDKLEAIPGYTVAPDPDRLRAVVAAAGCAIVGASADLAPADRRFYAIRDVTATVASQPLIVASILSKKLAAGVEGLVLDVKTGSGAFMRLAEDARALAQALVTVAARAGCPTRAVLSDMSQPLAPAAGNAVELRVALDSLRGSPQAAPRLAQMVLTLGAEALSLAGIDNGRARLEAALASGAAAEHFARMVTALGGPSDFLERPDAYLPPAPVISAIPAPQAGVVAGYDTRAIGQAVIGLGGGRRAACDRIDLRVGFAAIAPIGATVAKGDPLALVHAASEAAAWQACAAFLAACEMADTAQVPELVMEIL
ncbi:MAG: thymidine phosphorylase DeoA [Roseibaca calidilacus]|uniref:Thymidine phosphorylase n=2 Tax=Roseibaca calidilacus TaxID=1666912 RepID=A0A0P7VWW5_9RHOB|nr:thymidine phosphorylase [Roseibaca calidilacus]KPP91645.1 MAG: thymidine phosphorylase DeoA [Roseibaca calidilacus]CUX82762.1 thymidine phosphorylase [Roseibaca calidilacus]